MKKMFFAAVVCSFLSFSYALQTSTLTLNVDTNANELWFTGVNTGIPFMPAGNLVVWTDSMDLSSSPAINVSSCLSAANMNSGSIYFSEYGNDISVALYFNNSSTVSISGNGIHVDYSNYYNPAEMLIFEEIIANYTSISPSFSSSTSLAVIVGPGPITMALLGLGGLALGRRKA